MEHPFFQKAVAVDNISDLLVSLRALQREGVFRFRADGELLFCNSTFEALLGYAAAPEHLLLLDIFADPQEGEHWLRKAAAYGKIENERVLFRKQDGSNFWGLLSLKTSTGRGGAWLDGCVLDISAWRRTEDQLTEAILKLDRTSTELERFIYSASHNMRSPITSMKGLFILLQKEKQDEPIAQYTSMLADSLSKLERYIDELSAFAKATNQKISCRSVDPSHFLKLLLSDFNEHRYHLRVQPRINIQSDAPFSTDPDLLYSVLFNLVKNCFDYCDTSKVDCELAIDFVVQDDKAVIEVFDNGIGIPSSSIDHVFDLFYRATEISSGPGFGLYIAREATTRLGGVISLSSERGVGTLAKVEIPNAREKSDTDRREPERAKNYQLYGGDSSVKLRRPPP